MMGLLRIDAVAIDKKLLASQLPKGTSSFCSVVDIDCNDVTNIVGWKASSSSNTVTIFLQE